MNSTLYVMLSRCNSIHVAGDLNKKLLFVVGVLLTSFPRTYPLEPELPFAIKHV